LGKVGLLLLSRYSAGAGGVLDGAV
jgi:hypothetical protein